WRCPSVFPCGTFRYSSFLSGPPMHTLRLCALVLFLPLVIVALPGCGSKIQFVPVEGTVTYKGQALANVVVRFIPDADKGMIGPTSEGYTAENGRYTLRCQQPKSDGAVVGWHRVVIEDPAEERPMQGQAFTKPRKVPQQVSHPAQTPLKYEVK